MNGYTFGWILIGAAVAVLEVIALLNSRRGDTLSEHVWAFLGVGEGRADALRDVDVVAGTHTPKDPKWTLRLARFTLAAGILWLVVHLFTGGWW